MKNNQYGDRLVLIVMLLAGAALGGCDKLTPNGQSSTMTLLRAGSEQTCTASDVQDALHKLILPATAAGGDDPDRRAAMAGITLSYAFTTLSAFDKNVNKASCNTSVTIGGPNGASNKFDLEYQISPSADNPGTFVISTRNNDATTYAEQLVVVAATQSAADRATKQQQAQAQEAKAKLMAVVNPRWIAGTWIGSDKDPSNCADNRALTIGANHGFSSQGMNGQWSLDTDQMHFVGYGPNGGVNDTSTITQADAVSFTMASSDGTTSSWRRCRQDEIRPQTVAAPAPMPAPAAATPNLLDTLAHPEPQPN